MKNETNFEVFLFISSNKIILSVNRKTDFGLIFRDEIPVDNNTNFLNFDELNFFLTKNVFKIEKILGNFIERINVIIKTHDFFNLQKSKKKSNYNRNIDSNLISYLIRDAKHQCEKTIQNMRIIHILIDNYLVDNINFKDLPMNLKCKNFSMDITTSRQKT